MNRNRQDMGRKGELNVAALLNGAGRKIATPKGPQSRYDLLVDGWRVEIKTANPAVKQGAPEDSFRWAFNLQRHGVLSEQTDFYILRMEDIPFSTRAIHLLMKAPVGKMQIAVTVRSMMLNDHEMAKLFDRFKTGEFGTGPHTIQEAA